MIIRYLHALNNSITEVRLFPKAQRMNGIFVGKTVSGYYNADHYEQIASDIELLNGKADIYCTIHQPNESLLSRYNNRLEYAVELTTSDHDITHFSTFPLDIDPNRPSGISSNDAELENAQVVISRVAELFSELGFPEPIKALSGNGYHLHQLIKSLPVTDENIRRFKALGDAMQAIVNPLLRT